MSKSHERRGGRSPNGSSQPLASLKLSPQGHEFFRQLLDAASDEADYDLTTEDLLEALRRVREETGQPDPQFADPAIRECFKKHLRALGVEKRT